MDNYAIDPETYHDDFSDHDRNGANYPVEQLNHANNIQHEYCMCARCTLEPITDDMLLNFLLAKNNLTKNSLGMFLQNRRLDMIRRNLLNEFYLEHENIIDENMPIYRQHDLLVKWQMCCIDIDESFMENFYHEHVKNGRYISYR